MDELPEQDAAQQRRSGPGTLPPGSDPLPMRRQLHPAILLLGAGSTCASLVLVLILRGMGWDPMFFFIHLILPLGAGLMGLIAGIGFMLGSWWTQSRLSRQDFLATIALLIAAWIGLYLVEWCRLPAPGAGRRPVRFPRLVRQSHPGHQYRG